MQQDLLGVTHFQLTPRLLTHRFQRWAQELVLCKATFHLTAGNLAPVHKLAFRKEKSGLLNYYSWQIWIFVLSSHYGAKWLSCAWGRNKLNTNLEMVLSMAPGVRHLCSWVLLLPFINCVTLGKQFNLVYLSLLICQMGTIVITSPWCCHQDYKNKCMQSI